MIGFYQGAHIVRLRRGCDKRAFANRIRRWAKGLGFRIAIAADRKDTVLVTRLPEKHVSSGEWVGPVRRLYFEERWPVRRIARELGLSRVHVYRVIEAAGIRLEERGKRPPVDRLERDRLEHLYNVEHPSVPAIAKRLKVTPRDVASELERHGIWVDARVPVRFDFPQLAKLCPWKEFTVELDRPDVSRKLRREAKWHNIRIIVRADGPGRFRVIRLPFPTESVVGQLMDDGSAPTRTAKRLHVDPKTIRHLFRGKIDER